MNAAVAYVHEQLTGKKDFPKFKAGDNITVNYKIIEGNKERIQSFRGDVIKKQGQGTTATFTPGHSLEFVATFGAAASQHVGFVADTST